MYNTDYPDRADLPTSAQLIRSTIIAGICSVVILITIVLPSEYGIDPTRVGSLLGLTPMGEIKVQLAQEATAQAKATVTATDEVQTASVTPPSPAVIELERRIAALEALVSPVQQAAQAPAVAAAPEVVPLEVPMDQVADVERPQPSVWRDEVSFTLTPGQGTEYKMVMAAGAIASYEFAVDGGVINYDAHGEGAGQKASYEQARGVVGDTGQLQAPFEGTHGWFFRNRGTADVVVTLRTGGDYAELRKLI